MFLNFSKKYTRTYFSLILILPSREQILNIYCKILQMWIAPKIQSLSLCLLLGPLRCTWMHNPRYSCAKKKSYYKVYFVIVLLKRRAMIIMVLKEFHFNGVLEKIQVKVLEVLEINFNFQRVTTRKRTLIRIRVSDVRNSYRYRPCKG